MEPQELSEGLQAHSDKANKRTIVTVIERAGPSLVGVVLLSVCWFFWLMNKDLLCAYGR